MSWVDDAIEQCETLSIEISVTPELHFSNGSKKWGRESLRSLSHVKCTRSSLDFAGEMYEEIIAGAEYERNLRQKIEHGFIEATASEPVLDKVVNHISVKMIAHFKDGRIKSNNHSFTRIKEII